MKRLHRTILLAALPLALAAADASAQGDLFVREQQLTPDQLALRAPRPADTSVLEAALVNAVLRSGNARRAEAGLPPLAHDPALAAAAQRYSQRMRDRQFFAHVSPSGETLAERLPEQDRWRYRSLGENLWSAEGALDWRAEAIADHATADWILSPSHRDNLMEAKYALAGVGTATSGDKVFVTMLYGRLEDDMAVAALKRDFAAPPADLDGFARDVEWRLLGAVNEARAAAGLGPLQADTTLSGEARLNSAERLSAHAAGAPVVPGDAALRRVLDAQQGRAQRLGMSMWRAHGNLIWDAGYLARAVLETWSNRPDTRADLLDPGYDSAGLGVVSDGAGLQVTLLYRERAVHSATVRTGGAPVTILQQDGTFMDRNGGRYITIE